MIQRSHRTAKPQAQALSAAPVNKITWEKKAIVRHNKFDRSYGSRKANFVKVFVDDLPKELDALTVEFVNEALGKD